VALLTKREQGTFGEGALEVVVRRSLHVRNILRFSMLVLATVALVHFFLERVAFAQACCVGASGLTPGWLTNHERFLVGAQARISETHGTYPSSGGFFTRTPERDTRLETSLFGSFRWAARGQASVNVPLVATRRRSGALVETGTAPGDITLIGRYDFVRAGESRMPGVALLGGVQAPTGKPSDEGTGDLAPDVTGIGAWEVNGGASVEQVFGHLVLHATALFGYRWPRDVAGVEQHLGLRALYLVAGGWVFDDDVSLLVTLSHLSEGDAVVAGDAAEGTGSRTTQAALLVIVPISDTLRLRTSVFTDVPPLGTNRPAFGGTSISIAKSWF
jgi:hypothetical protein